MNKKDKHQENSLPKNPLIRNKMIWFVVAFIVITVGVAVYDSYNVFVIADAVIE